MKVLGWRDDAFITLSLRAFNIAYPREMSTIARTALSQKRVFPGVGCRQFRSERVQSLGELTPIGLDGASSHAHHHAMDCQCL